MPQFKILNSATEEEVAVIVATINILSHKELVKETEIFSKWENYSRRGQQNRELWENDNNSLWQLECKKL